MKGGPHNTDTTRSMTGGEIKAVIVNSFAAVNFKIFQIFLGCSQDNSLSAIEEQLNGDDLLELAGQGSIYIYVKYVYDIAKRICKYLNLTCAQCLDKDLETAERCDSDEVCLKVLMISIPKGSYPNNIKYLIKCNS